MNLNRIKVNYLLNMYFQGNYNRFARTIGITPSHLYRFLTDGVGGGKKMAGALMKFCKEKKLNFEDYIEL